MTLTEQLKKGELKDGHYFFKTKDNIKIGFLYEGFKYPYDGRYNTIDNVEEVLAPVPSYEELEQLKIDNYSLNAWIKNFQPKYKKMEKENQQLKELLNYIRDEIADMPVYAKQQGFGWISEAAYRIDNAIGEK